MWRTVFCCFFCLFRAQKLWLKISCISCIAFVSACPFLCLLLIFYLFSSFSSFLTVTVVRVDKSVTLCGHVVLNQQKLFAVFFIISSTSQFLTVMFAGGSWGQYFFSSMYFVSLFSGYFWDCHQLHDQLWRVILAHEANVKKSLSVQLRVGM